MNSPPVRTCHLCREPLPDTFVTTPNGLAWCVDLAGCKFRAGRRLGLPLLVSLDAHARDLDRRIEAIRSAPLPARDAAYVQHMASDSWRVFADEQRLHAGFRCEWPTCRVRDHDLTVHHLHYDRLGQERPQDVLVLCPICHRDLDVKRRQEGLVPDVKVTANGMRRVVNFDGRWVVVRQAWKARTA